MRKRLVLVALTAAAMAVLPAGLALANNGDPSSAMATPPPVHSMDPGRGGGTITFYGSGWGHGVGMSQWGAYGLAKQGWSYTDILKRYYSNTTVAPASAGSPTSVRVGLTWARSSLHLTAQGDTVTLRFGRPSAPDKFSIPAGRTWTVALDANGKFVITNAGGRTYPPIGGPNWRMYAAYTQNQAQLRIPEAGHAYGRGTIEFDSYKLGSAWAIRAIGILDPDQYLYGLGEVPNSWPLDALKVQAVAGRTYAFDVIAEHHGQHYSDCNCDLYPDARSQSYLGWDKESDTLGNMWRQAVNQTSGQVVLYHGALILANYYSTSGGYTESNENVWFNQPVPYLRSVCDPGDYSAPVGLRTWKETLSSSQVGGAFGVGTVSSFSNVTRSTNSGRIISVTVNGSGGLRGSSTTVSGPQFSSALGLMDDKVWMNQNRNIEGAIRNEYDSLDCAPGLAMSPQFSADSGSVQRFADGSIYTNPKAKAPVWLNGSVYSKYLAFGGANTVLGLPRTGVIRLNDAAGCGQALCTKAVFDGGRIYDKGKANAHEIHGRVMTYWLKTGGVTGVLGFPTSDVTKLPSGSLRSTFEHGSVTCPSSGACTRS
jgi:SpoIID/LytB domain protein